MAGLIPDAFIEELLARVDIVEVIERRVPLKKSGHEWTACCPFHNENTPSFTVSPHKQFYHCFGCGAHGTAIRFLMEYEHLEFPDAIEELAQGLGLDVPREGGSAPTQPRNDGLYPLLDQVATHYQGALASQAKAQAYCEQRGLDAETVAAFRIGWAGDNGLIRALGGSRERLQMLEQAGMLSRNDRGAYERFRQRLMFPILDRRGRVIAFGGRLLEGDGPKYLNSPETPLFHKGRELFALWQARQSAKRLARILVVEGYMDAIALHQAGLRFAVATLGTATTEHHAEQLFRAAPEVVFAFDGDRAGRQAAWRALESVLPHLRQDREARFLFLPEGEDPDSLVRKEGKQGFEARLSRATPLSEYLFDNLGNDIDLAAMDGRARLAERARPLLAKIPAGAFRELMHEELERRSGARASRRHDAPPARHPQASRPGGNARRSLVRSTIIMLLADPSLAHAVEQPYAFAALRQPGIDLLVALLDAAREREQMTAAMLLERFADTPYGEALGKLAMVELPSRGDALRQEFLDALAQFDRQLSHQRIADLMARQGQGGLDADEKQELRGLLADKAQAGKVAVDDA